MTGIGMNLASVTYWSTQEPFIDRFKTSGAWVANNGGTVVLDDQGYPVALPAGASNVATSFAVDSVDTPYSDVYVLTYTGTAKIKLVNATILSNDGNKITFTPKDGAVSVYMAVSQISAADPIGDIHVV